MLGGSVPAGVPAGIYTEMIDRIRDLDGRVVLDTSGAPLREALASPPDVLKPNVEELAELVGRLVARLADVRAAARSLVARGVRLVVVSMGADGALFVDRIGRCWRARPRSPCAARSARGTRWSAGSSTG